MDEEGAECPDNPSHEEQQRLEAARSLLERNGALVFELNGLAALRRTAGGRRPSAEERALLAQAQRCLQDAASMLPPQILVPAAMTKRLREQLKPAVATAAQEAHARKRYQVVPQLKRGQEDERQAEMNGLHLEDVLQPAPGDQRKQGIEQLENMVFSRRIQRALEGQTEQESDAGAPPPQQPEQQQPEQQAQAGDGSSGPNDFAGSPRQRLPSGALRQAYLHGLRRQASFGDALGGSSARPSADLVQPSVNGQGAGLGGAAQHVHPPVAAPALGGEQLAGEDVYLLSKAYSSMSTEQKERLAAQPPEVRQYVLRERMRRTKQQLQVLQQLQAAGSGGNTPPPNHKAARPSAAGQQQIWPPGIRQSSSPPPAAGEQHDGGMPAEHQLAWRQRQQQQQAQQAQQAQRPVQQPSPAPSQDLGCTADSQLLQQEQQQRALPVRLASLGQLPPGALAGLQQVGAQLPGGLGALLDGGAAAAARRPGGSQFASLDEQQRLEHLHSLKRRQEEWLEQQRLAAAHTSRPGSG